MEFPQRTFNKISEIDSDNKIKIAVASHTPLYRGLEALDAKKGQSL